VAVADVELQSVGVLAEETVGQQNCHFLAALMAQLVAAAQVGILVTATLEPGVLVDKVGMVAMLPVPLFRGHQMAAV
jgi:hypothetical protein